MSTLDKYECLQDALRKKQGEIDNILSELDKVREGHNSKAMEFYCEGPEGDGCNTFFRGGIFLIPPIVDGWVTCPICGTGQKASEAREIWGELQAIIREKYKARRR